MTLLRTALSLLMLATVLAAASAQAAISFRVAASAQGNTTSVGLARPDGTGEGDFMLVTLQVEGRSSGQITTVPAGWTAIGTVTNDNSVYTQVAYYRFATAADVAGAAPTWTWGWAGNREHTASLLVFRGVDTTTPINASAVVLGTTTSAAVTVPAVVPSVANTMLVGVAAINRGSTFTWSGAMAEATDVATGAGGGNVSHTTAWEVGPAAGVSSGTRTATAAAGTDNRRVGQMIALAPAVVPGPVLRWRFDESGWNGTAGEVRDASGNGLAGRAFGTGTTATTTAANNGSPAFCRSGTFSSASSQYAQTADNALLDITDRLTVTAWVRPASLGGALNTVVSKDENYEFHVTNNGAVNWWWTAGANAITTSNGDVPLNAWTHIAIVYTRGAQEVYVNGALAGNNWASPDRNALTTNADPFQVGNDQGFAGRFWNGQLDEVRVYNYAMSAADVLAVRNEVPAPLCPLDHFAVVPAGGASASTCLAKNFTVTAQDVNNATVSGYVGTVNLTTTTERGDWANVDGVNGAGFNNGAANDGAAQYTFLAGDNGDVVLALTDRSQDDLVVTATDAADSAVTGSSITVNFRDNAFIFAEDLASLVAGSDVAVAGRSHDMRATYIYRDSVTANCGTLTSYTGAKTIKAWVTRAGTDPGGAAPQIGATSLPNAAPGGNNLSITFTNGVASFNLATTDVGKYAVNFRDDAPGVANTAVSGSSGQLTVRPFTLAVNAIRQGATNNPGSNTPAGTLFAAAGTSFQMTLGAYRWNAPADANNDGVPDNGATFAQVSGAGLTPSFAATAAFTAVAPFTPAPGGMLNNGTFAVVAGTATPTNLNFTEVGSFTLSTANVVTGYLGTGGLNLGATVFNAAGAQTTSAPVVGRFRPDHFFLQSAGTLTNRSALACASTFTYMNEGLALAFTLRARNALNAVTANYTTASGYAKLNPATIAQLGFGAVALNPSAAPTNLTSRLDLSLGSAGTFVGGDAAVTATLGVMRASPDNPDGPYTNARFGVAPGDSDGTAMRTSDFNLDVDNNATNDRAQVGSATQLRFGRLRLHNAVGSQKTALAVPIEAQYWTGGGFAVNTLDSCTRLARNAIELGGYVGALAPGPDCRTFVLQDPVTFTQGAAALALSAPGVAGSVLVTPNLGATTSGAYCASAAAPPISPAQPAGYAYLLGRWNDAANPDGIASTAYDDKPAARAAFGLYGGQPQSFIFQRENH